MPQLLLRNFTDVIQELGTASYFLFSVLSSEDRSTACIEKLIESDKLPKRLYLSEYPSIRDPEDEMKRVNKLYQALSEKLKKSLHIDSETNPYAFSQLVRQLMCVIKEAGSAPLLVDFTCMTIVHALALVDVLSSSGLPGHGNIYLCYTTPGYYGFERIGDAGWKDVLFVPIGDLRQQAHEGHARGLILAGHDAEPLGVALEEFEPDGGIVLYTRTMDRPDFERRAREENRTIVMRLLSLRIINSTSSAGIGVWSEESTVIDDTERIESVVSGLVESAAADRGPILLYPFGPKLAVVSAALALSKAAGVSSWAVCPTPTAYQADFSVGSGTIYCVSPES